jgi:hypothetical protein
MRGEERAATLRLQALPLPLSNRPGVDPYSPNQLLLFKVQLNVANVQMAATQPERSIIPMYSSLDFPKISLIFKDIFPEIDLPFCQKKK